MNVLKAAEETMELWSLAGSSNIDPKSSLSFNHCMDMLKIMQTNKQFSYGKLCRWLGWMQAACVAATDLSLEDMKTINMQNRDRTESSKKYPFRRPDHVPDPLT